MLRSLARAIELSRWAQHDNGGWNDKGLRGLIIIKGGGDPFITPPDQYYSGYLLSERRRFFASLRKTGKMAFSLFLMAVR
jgi:hypothetical protein